MNWGKSITIVIILFMAFILYMVFRLSATKVDLVAEDYYAQELAFEDEIHARSNAAEVKDIEIKVDENFVTLIIPGEVAPSDSIGYIHFYRPDNASYDLKFKPKANQEVYLTDKEDLLPGRYNVKVKWVSVGKAYVTDKSVFIP